MTVPLPAAYDALRDRYIHDLGIGTTRDMKSVVSFVFLRSWQFPEYTLSRDYFDRLQAPIKGFYTFEQSAHSPMFEEPEKVQQILREDVLPGTNQLADR